MRNVTREEIKASVDKTVERIRKITQDVDHMPEDRVFQALSGHFRRTGQDELCEALDDFIIGWTDKVPATAA